ncbi:MAG: GNAT family N-acetyltransferase [Hyphomicrobiaceae bacterium]
MAQIAEEIERAALEDLHAAATPEIRQELGIAGPQIGSAFVSIARKLPATAIVINRAIGLGLSIPETEKTVSEIVEAFRSADVKRYFVQIHPEGQPNELEHWLISSGLQKARGWQKFSRGRESLPELKTTALSVREIAHCDAEASAAIVCDAFDLGEAARPWLQTLPGRERWHVFMSFDGDRPAGTGALFIDGDFAWTDFGATAPAYRGRGSQSALLRLRVEHALDHGCKQVFTCTGEAVPGDPQHSYSNILRCGFKEDYVRSNYSPPSPKGT